MNIPTLIHDTLNKILKNDNLNSNDSRKDILISYYTALSDLEGPPNFRDKDIINKLI